LARNSTLPGWSEVIDAATYSAALRRRRRAVAWLVKHPKTRIALRLTRGAWRHRHLATRPVLAVWDFAADQAGKRWVRWRHRASTHESRHEDRVRCGQCGRMIRIVNARSHMAWHARWPGTTDQPRRTAIAPGRTPGQPGHRPPGTTRPSAPEPSRTSGPGNLPARTTRSAHHHRNTISRGAQAMSANITANPLARAAREISSLEPVNAWEFDAQVAGLARGSVALSDSVGSYAETLDATGIDGRVSGHILTAMEHLASAGTAFAHAGTAFRTLYAAHLEAAEAGVKQPKDAGFFDPSKA
jgi:hypothetical protein